MNNPPELLTLLETAIKESSLSSEISSKKIETRTKNYSDSFSEGNDSNLGRNFLAGRRDGFINENWDKTILISGRILKVQKDSDIVHCDCIISRERSITEVRQFPKIMFDNVYPLKEGTTVCIKISTKKGSTRTDIIDGKGLGIEKEFETFDIWNELEGFENKPAF